MGMDRRGRAQIVANGLRRSLSCSAIAKLLGKECPATRQLIKGYKRDFPDLFWGMPGPNAQRITL